METLCERLDQLTLEYLDEFGHFLACKQLIDDTMKNGYFNLSRARVIMGVNNLSRLQYSEREPMNAATRLSISSSSSSPFDFDKEFDRDRADDTLKWFGLLTPKVLKESQKSFQQTIDLVLEACRRQTRIEQLKVDIEQLKKEKKTFLTKENIAEEKSID